MDTDAFSVERTFSGTYTHTLDSKGRVSLPAKFRKSLPVALKLVPRGGTIHLFTIQDYQSWVGEFFEGGKPDPRSREDSKTLFSLTAHAEDTDIDSAGRISISAELCKRAGLEKEVKIVGMFGHIEIMSPEKYASMDEESEDDEI
ncbi:MAG: MraZ family transcriptional regulator [Coriobacteriales bacterium]|jgi:MraZ protein